MSYAKHVAQIAKANKVKVVFVKRLSQCYGYIAARTIYIMPVTNERTYAVAMHELGHILGPMQNYWKRIPGGTFAEAEIGAWLWARENTQFWLVGMQKTLVECLKSYNDNSSDKRFKPAAACPAYSKLF